MNGQNGWIQLLYKGVIVQSVVTVMFCATLCVLWGMGRPVPTELYAVTTLCLGFWGGSTGAIVAQHNGAKSEAKAIATRAAADRGDV
jgi:hypothetical protein